MSGVPWKRFGNMAALSGDCECKIGAKLVYQWFQIMMHPPPVRIRDKAQGPQLSSHNPLNGLSSQPLNYVHNFNLTNDHQEKKVPHLKHVLLPEISCKIAAVCLLSFTEKGCWRGFKLCSNHPKNGECSNSSPLFNQRLDWVKTEKRPAVHFT